MWYEIPEICRLGVCVNQNLFVHSVWGRGNRDTTCWESYVKGGCLLLIPRELNGTILGPPHATQGRCFSREWNVLLKKLQGEERSPREGQPDRSADGNSLFHACGWKLEASPSESIAAVHRSLTPFICLLAAPDWWGLRHSQQSPEKQTRGPLPESILLTANGMKPLESENWTLLFNFASSINWGEERFLLLHGYKG